MIPMPTVMAPLPEQPVEIDFSTDDKVYIKYVSVEKAGTVLEQHRHPYDHTTFVACGGVNLWVEGDYVGAFKAPVPLSIKAKRFHCFQTTEDNTVICCIHNATHDPVAEVWKEHEI